MTAVNNEELVPRGYNLVDTYSMVQLSYHGKDDRSSRCFDFPFCRHAMTTHIKKYSKNPTHIYSTLPVPFTAKTVVTSC